MTINPQDTDLVKSRIEDEKSESKLQNSYIYYLVEMLLLRIKSRDMF